MTQEQTQQPNNKWPKHRLTFNDNLIEDIEIHLIPSLESLKEVKTIPLHNSKIEIDNYTHESIYIRRDKNDTDMNLESHLCSGYDYEEYSPHGNRSYKTIEEGNCREISVYIENNTLNIKELDFKYDKSYVSSLGGIKRDNLELFSHWVFPLSRLIHIKTDEYLD